MVLTPGLQLNQFFSELHAEESKSKKRLFVEGGFKVPRRKSGLPQHLYSVMGSANLRLARGDSAGAIALCKEVIRQGQFVNYVVINWTYEVRELLSDR